jgi:hypothetical protein
MAMMIPVDELKSILLKFGRRQFSTQKFIDQLGTSFPKTWARLKRKYGRGGKGGGNYTANTRVAQILNSLSKDGLLHKIEKYQDAPPDWGSPVIRYWTRADITSRSSKGATLGKNSYEATSTVSIPAGAPAETKRSLQAIAIRRGQPAFRKLLMYAYGGACAVTGCTEIAALEAVHIYPFSKKGRYAAANGLLLRADLHTLFDAGLWAIEPNTRQIRISREITDKNYQRLNGRRIRGPRDVKFSPRKAALAHRYRSFITQNKRERP